MVSGGLHPATPPRAGGACGGRRGGRWGRPSERRRTGGSHALLPGISRPGTCWPRSGDAGISFRRPPGGSRAHRPSPPAAAPVACAPGSAPASASAAPPAAPDATGGGRWARAGGIPDTQPPAPRAPAPQLWSPAHPRLGVRGPRSRHCRLGRLPAVLGHLQDPALQLLHTLVCQGLLLHPGPATGRLRGALPAGHASGPLVSAL